MTPSASHSRQPSPGRARKLGWLVLPYLVVALPILIVVLTASFIWIEDRYYRRSRAINMKICSLEKRRPAHVSAEIWSECVAWASIAHGNICFSKEHTDYEAMCRFERQLDDKLKEDVDLTTLEWIGDRLAETGPHGQQYMDKWREQWKSILQRVEQGDTR